MDSFVLIIACLAIGMALRRSSKFPDNTAVVLNLYVIYVCLPALTLLKIPELSLSLDLLAPVLMPWLMLAVSAAMVVLLSRLFGWEPQTTGALMLLVPMGNTSFLGIPMVRAFLGAEGVPYAVLYDQLGSFLILSTYGTAIIAAYSGGERVSAWEIAVRIVTFPPFIALAAALVLAAAVDEPPALFTNLMGTLAATLVPVVMISVGFQLELRLHSTVWKPMAAGLAVKLLAAPLIALAVCRVLGLDSLPARVAVFEAGMPPMISAGALAIMAGLAPTLTAALVGVGIFASFMTLPLLYQLFP